MTNEVSLRANTTLAPDSAVMVGVAAASAPASRRAVTSALWRCGLVPLLPPETGDLQPVLSQAAAYIDVLTQLPSARAEQALRLALSRALPTLLFLSVELVQRYQPPCSIISFKALDELSALIVEQLTALSGIDESAAAFSLHSPYTCQVPAQPSPYLAHSHYLARRLIGRAAELEALRLWSASATPVLLLTGEEGIGKSALLWHWLLEERLSMAAQLLMLWDFAESDGGFANFVRHALAYFSGKPLSAVDNMPRPERLSALLQSLAAQPALLVLENAQKLLSAYDSLLPSQSDDLSESSPANAEIDAFLRALPTFKALKSVLIAPTMPSVYRDIPSVQHMALGALSAADAEQLLAHSALFGKPELLTACANALQRHPLSLCLAAENGNAHPDGFNAWWQLHSAKFERAQSLQARLRLLVELATAGLSSDARALLHYLAALGFPVPYRLFLRHALFQLEPVRTAGASRRQQLTDEISARSAQRIALDQSAQRSAVQARLHTILSDLERRNLLRWDRATNRYALHTLVCQAVQATWTREERRAALSAVQRTLEPLSMEVPEALQDESDLRAAVALYAARLSAGNPEQAARFYRERLSKPLLMRLADAHAVMRLLMPFFPNGAQALPELDVIKERAYLGHEMALALRNLNRLAEAQALLGQALLLFIEAHEPAWLCTALINYGSLVEDQRALRIRTFELARRLATVIGDIESRAVANFVLLRSYVEVGQWAAAIEAYEAFSASVARYRTVARQATAERLIAQMLLQQGQDPSGSLNLAWELAVQSNAIAEKRAIHAVWGEVALTLMNRPDAAERFFEEALRMADHEADFAAYYRGGLARAYALQGRREEAQALLAQGVPSLAAAQVHLALGELAAAESAARAAYQEAWSEGAPFSLWWELEQARAVLRELRLPPPDLPPYQPENFPPLPHERALRAYVLHLERGAQAETVQPAT